MFVVNAMTQAIVRWHLEYNEVELMPRRAIGETVRALLVGYGSIARRHIESLRACGVNELLVTRSGGKAAIDSADKASFVADVATAIERRPDIAVIATPSALHIDALLPLLRAGISCYVEKPAVTDARHVAQLRELLASSGAPPVTLTGCNLRFLPSLQRLRAALAAGTIGTPVRASLQAGQWLPDWRPAQDYRRSYSAQSAQGGGVIFDLIHEIDIARWLFGEFEQVRSLSGKLSRLEIESEDTACILLGRKAGPIVAIGLDYVSRQPLRRYEIVGDEGTLSWDLGAMRLSLATPGGTEVLDEGRASFDVPATYLTAMREFLAAVGAGRQAAPDLLDGLRTTELALKAHAAP
jgi:predicted dehydrogenase